MVRLLYMPIAGRHCPIHALVIIVVLMVLAVLVQLNVPRGYAAGASYYVAPNGSDGNPGTLAAPFATIQKCANVASAGDTCYIRGGTYRETVTPINSGTASSPLVFQAYNGEAVTVSGADNLGGWSVHNSSIYKTSAQNWNLGLGNNQVFVDGVMVNDARWPNMSANTDPSHPTLARVDSGSYTGDGTGAIGTINDNGLPANMQDARINAALGDGYLMQTGIVTSSWANGVSFQYNRFDNYIEPKADQAYFIWGKLSLLDTANETFYDGSTLYLQTRQNDNPANHSVEAKRRQYAFDLRNRSYIQVGNIGVFAATIVTNGNSQGNVLDGIWGRYLTHGMNITGSPWEFLMYDSGIVLTGNNNTLTNSVLEYSSANGVSLSGTNQHVTKSIIHDVNYAATDASAVTTGTSGSSITSQGHEIRQNTMYNSGRSILIHRGSTQVQITYNDLYNSGLQVEDLGVTYTWGSDGAGSVIAYNLVHDNLSERYGGMGIYLDNNSHNFTVHHNVVWNVGTALNLNKPSTNNKIYNNTLFGGRESVGSGFSGSMSGTELKNNIFTSYLNGMPGEVVQQNNLFIETNPQFVDPYTHNYTLQSTSPAVNAGQIVSPYTDGYIGAAPDIGAYEYGAVRWHPGVGHSALDVIEAESYSAQNGVNNYGSGLSHLDNGDWVQYSGINFGNGINQFRARIGVPAEYAGQQIEVRLGSTGGTLLGTLTVGTTGDWSTFTLQFTSLTSPTGVHTLYLVFKGSSGVGNLDWIQFAHARSARNVIEAESYDAQIGVTDVITSLGGLDNGDWVQYLQVDFGSGISQFQARIGVPHEYAGQQIEVRIDSLSGTLLGTLTVSGTGDWSTFTTQSVSISNTTGVHTLYLIFKGGSGVGLLDWIQFD